MSLITRCPACTTMFKVVPDQLRISDGWVRCGQCDEVFDANAHLQPTFETVPEVVHEEKPSEFDWGSMLDVEAKASDEALALEFPLTKHADAPASVVEDNDDPIPSAFSDQRTHQAPDAALLREADFDVSVDPLDAVPATGTDWHAGVEVTADQDPPPEPVSESVPALEEPPIPQFLKPERTPRARRSRGARVAWVSLSVLLGCMLVVQVLVQERDRIVATAPSLAFWMQPLCHAMGCKISPLQQIESIMIDQSSFSKAQGGGYVLGFSVKSTALTEVAIPSLELTLTDMQDRPLVRRVFTPRELGSQEQVLSPGGEWSGAVPVDAKLPDGAERISGYRLLAFYP